MEKNNKKRNTFFDKVKDGVGLGIGFVLVIGLIIGVYSFVQPTLPPSASHVMTSFTSAQNSITSDFGKYNNRIPDQTFSEAYTEVCFKDGTYKYDIHPSGGSTEGGNCLPGDIGFVIEKNERSATIWTTAKATCLENGDMRLPEPFEWQFACMHSSTLQLSGMGNAWEWASNFALPMYYSNYGVGAAKGLAAPAVITPIGIGSAAMTATRIPTASVV